MKAIMTRTLPATLTKPSRVTAYDCDGNRVTITAVPATFGAHRDAARALCEKMKWANAHSLVGGETDKGYAWVFTQTSDPIQRREIVTRKDHMLSVFYNRDTDLLVIDLTHSVRAGGNELVRRTLDEAALLKHCDKFPTWEEEARK